MASDKRNYLVILADVSGSMGEAHGGTQAPIAQLRDALEEMVSTGLPGIRALRDSGEVAIGLFAGREGQPVVNWIKLGPDTIGSHPFHRLSGGLSVPKQLDAWGTTPLVDACFEGLAQLERRREVMAEFDTQYKPVVILISDGKPDRAQRVKKLAAEIQSRAYRSGVEGAEFLFLAFGTDGADMDTLATIAPHSNWDMRGKAIADCIKMVTESLPQAFSPTVIAEAATRSTREANPDHAVLYGVLGNPYVSRMR